LLGFGRVLKHEGALEVAAAVKPRGQPEMAFEQRAGAAEAVE
jgi:hypothetical protein